MFGFEFTDASSVHDVEHLLPKGRRSRNKGRKDGGGNAGSGAGGGSGGGGGAGTCGGGRGRGSVDDELFTHHGTRPLEFEFAIGSFGTEPGKFNAPTGLCVVNEHQRLYVADAKNHRIQVFTIDGTLRVMSFPRFYFTSTYKFRAN